MFTSRAQHHPAWPPAPLAAALIVILLGACSTRSAEPSASLTSSASPGPSIDSSATRSAAPTGPPTVGLAELEHVEIDLAGGPDWPTFLDGSVWILAPDGPLQGGEEGPLVYRLDATTGEEQARVPIGGRLCQGIAAGFGSVWACTDAGLSRIDPATNEVVADVAFPAAQVFVRPVMTDDRVWMLAGNVFADRLVEIDPAANEVVATHPLGHVATGLAAGDGALWASVTADGLILRIDPSSGEVSVHAEGLPGPATVAHGAGSLWVGLYGEHGGEVAAAGEPVIVRLSVTDGSEEAEIAIGATSMFEGDIWAGDEAVWVRAASDPFLVQIDPADDSVVSAIAGFHAGGSVTVVDEVVWTTSIGFGTAWRIAP
jgi:streptogramin lyase